ncbi:MAG: NUDIX domain-containing protein [Chloroflexia bacterium]
MDSGTRGHESFSVAVDLVVWTLHDSGLHLLLVQRGKPPFPGLWALPGGFVGPGEALDEAARRELAEETGVHDVPLLPFRAFGDPGRDPRGRVLSVAYTTLVDRQRLTLRAGSDARAVSLFAMGDLPALAFDHAQIVQWAHRFLYRALWCTAIAAWILPPVFGWKELCSVYAQLLLQRPGRRLLRTLLGPHGVLEPAGMTGRRGLYRFRKEAVERLHAGSWF